MTDFREITTSDSLDNIFNDIAREANITVKDAKRNIEIHGSSPILLVRNYLLGNDSSDNRHRISATRNCLKFFQLILHLTINNSLTQIPNLLSESF